MTHRAISRRGSDAVMIALLLLFPIVQIVATRSLPAVLAVCLGILGLTAWLDETRQWRNVFDIDGRSNALKTAIAFVLAMALYALLTSFGRLNQWKRSVNLECSWHSFSYRRS